jgi:hypothetical protein
MCPRACAHIAEGRAESRLSTVGATLGSFGRIVVQVAQASSVVYRNRPTNIAQSLEFEAMKGTVKYAACEAHVRNRVELLRRQGARASDDFAARGYADRWP